MNFLDFADKHLDCFSLISATTGVGIIWYYLTDVRLDFPADFQLLMLGVMLCSTSMVVALLAVFRYGKATYPLLLVLFILSYGFLTIYTFRYDVFGGPDVIGEFVIASKTNDLERWPLESQYAGAGDRAGRYASCLSVTILPTILSKATGLSVLDIFRYIMPAFGAAIPIVLFLVVKEIFHDEKLAFLSAMLFGTSHLQIFMLSYLNREQISNFFLLLSIYAVVKSEKSKGYVVAASVFLLSIVFSAAGHAVADFSLLIFLGFAIAPVVMKLLRKKSEVKLLFSAYFLFLAFCQFVWLYFVARPLFDQHIDVLNRMSTSIFTYFPAYLNRVLTTGEILPSVSAISTGIPTSRLLSYWYYLTVGLAGLGMLYSLYRRMQDSRRTGWITGGGLFMFLVFGFSILATSFLLELDSGRIFAEPFFYFFLAIPLYALFFERPRKKYLKYVMVIPIVFVFISLPFNLNLPDHDRILHYHAEQFIPQTNRVTYFDTDYRDLQFSFWIQDYIPESDWISVDLKGFHIAYLADHTNKTYQSAPTFSEKSAWLIVPKDFVIHDLWVSPYPYTIYPSKNISLAQIFMNTDTIYSNGEELLVMRMIDEPVG